MKKSTVMKFAASALVLGTTAIGCKPGGDAHPNSLSATTPKAAKGAALAAGEAERALAKKDAAKAIASAEQAVALQPTDVRYRQLLGRAYLAGGRFASAETSFADAVALDPDNGRAQVSLALAQIATGEASTARATLAAAAGKAAEADRGLALALAGDPTGAVRVLETAARTPGADAKTRQNLALSYALAGDWAKAQATAAQDLSPGEVAERMVAWAKFAHATDATRQVASLIGVTPVLDGGQPVRLALAPTPVQTAAVDVAAAGPEAGAAPAVDPVVAPVEIAAVDPAPVAATAAGPLFFKVPSRTPSIPALIRAPKMATKVAMATPRVPALLAAPQRVAFTRVKQGGGNWVVQLGAFSNRTSIESAWGKVTRLHRLVGGYTPSQARFTMASATLTRLSLAGFVSRDAAVQVCTRVRAAGGDCFVRQAAGEAPVQMAARRTAVQLASR